MDLPHASPLPVDAQSPSGKHRSVCWRRLRAAAAWSVSLMPTSGLRVALYRCLFGYRLEGSAIGWRTVIDVESFIACGTRIGRSCEFLGPVRVELGHGVCIGNANHFSCGRWALDYPAFLRELRVGPGVLITNGHHFDLAGSVVIGKGTWIAGCGSQFWTHGPTPGKIDVRIGEDCYIGSAARFVPGAAVGDRVMVAVGSVVCGALSANDALVAGVPAAVRREHYEWRVKGCFAPQPATPATGPTAAC